MTTGSWFRPSLRAAGGVLLVLVLALAPAHGAGSGAGDGPVARLPWGAPDLQGTWTTATVTTLERGDQFDQLVLTEREAAAVEKFGADFLAKVDDLKDGDLPAGSDVGGYNSFWMDPGTRVLRVRGEPRSSIIVDPANGKVPYSLAGRARYTMFALKFRKTDHPEQRLLGERCMVGFGSTGGPPMLPVLYNNNYQFVQSPGQVGILVEMNHNLRNIPIDSDPLPAAIRPWLGDSVGHWDGDSLVVRTTNFHPQQNFRAAIKHRLYMEPDTVVVERFTRISRDEIVYEFTVTDDSLYSQPWKGQLTMRRRTDVQIYEYACHEGNYALPNILAGARQEEKQ